MTNSILQDIQYAKQGLRTAQALIESLSNDLDLADWPSKIACDIAGGITAIIETCMELEILIIKEEDS